MAEKKKAPAPAPVQTVVEPDEPTRAVDIIRRHTGRMYPSPDCPLSECPSNLDLTTQRGKALAIAASNPADLEVKDATGLVETFTHFLIFADSQVDEDTGEVSEFPRTVLFTREGLTFRTSSEHMPHKIAQICDLFGEEGWRQGITCRIQERRSRKTGRTYHDLRIEVEPTTED